MMQRTDYSLLGENNETAEVEEEEDWRLKYRSAFTYADYNDLDNMGYEPPKRYSTQVGARYQRFTYSSVGASLPEADPPSLQTTAVEGVFVALSFFIFLLTLPLSLLFSLKFVGDFERLVVLRLGRAQKTRGPGATVVLPCIDTCTKVDLRVSAFNVPPMQIITVDRGLVELGATVFLQIKDALAAVCAVRERNQSTRTLAVATLHRVVCKRRVCDIVSGHARRELAGILQDELSELTMSWGVQITKVEVSEVKVIKEGENIALTTFKKIMKSDFGNQVLQTITTTVQEFIAEQQEKEHNLIELSPTTETKPQKEEIQCEHSPNECSVDVDELLGTISMVLDERLVALVGHVFQVNCEGVDEFYVDLKTASGSCSRGRHSNADVTFCLDRAVFIDILKKRISPTQAYLCGALKIIGPIQAAMKLTFLADRINELL
ncbi:Stomatin-like protein 1 [Toxocara canis]|uniref:Stomatin-like protein 1 n=1 Tax=Toxocara canis TaxID=6265 RepID=A0A0B2V7U7_TOXCA|nr:Stomatin-like protein 1 [Toxocara canis]